MVSFKGDGSVEFSRLPIDLGIYGFQEGVTKEDFIIIYFSHKEGMFTLVSFVADFQDCYLSYFSCFVSGAIHIFYFSQFL